jgi:hypothetical protein
LISSKIDIDANLWAIQVGIKIEQTRIKLTATKKIHILCGSGSKTKTLKTNSKLDTADNNYGPRCEHGKKANDKLKPRDSLNHAEKNRQLK